MPKQNPCQFTLKKWLTAGRSSSSMERPSLIMRWMRVPNVLGSSREKPLVSSAVSKSSSTRSFTVLSLLSTSARFFSSCRPQASISQKDRLHVLLYTHSHRIQKKGVSAQEPSITLTPNKTTKKGSTQTYALDALESPSDAWAFVHTRATTCGCTAFGTDVQADNPLGLPRCCPKMS